MATLIGAFKADQQRERLLKRDSYSHLVVVFDSAVVFVEVSPIRDAAAAAIHHIPVPLPYHVKLARGLLRLGPKYDKVEATVEEMDSLTPESLAEAFPNHVRALNNAQIKSAILRRLPPRLRLKYRSNEYAGEQQIWLKLSLLDGVDDASRIMSEALGARFRTARRVEGILDEALSLLPG